MWAAGNLIACNKQKFQEGQRLKSHFERPTQGFTKSLINTDELLLVEGSWLNKPKMNTDS